MELPPDRSAPSSASSCALPVRGVPQLSSARVCRIAMRLVADAHGVPLSDLRATTRRAPAIAQARQCAMYLAHVAFALSFGAIGRAFGRDRTTAAHACRRIEDCRDDPAFDRAMAHLEQTLTAAVLRGGDGR